MVTLGLAILLAVGLLAAKLCQFLCLPSVTGYIVAGLLLGPSGVGLITSDTVGSGLDHFTHIALMLIAFGIGEHIELKRLRQHARSVACTGLGEIIGAFVLVSTVTFVVIRLLGFEVAGGELRDVLVLVLLLGAIGVATAPAATLMVVREMRASGPFTSTLLAVVAVDNGLAIMIFGLMVSISHQLVGAAPESLSVALLMGVADIGQALLLGITTGLLLDLTLRRFKRQEEMVTWGLALLLLCSELARFLEMSPLLAGMAAGCILVSRAERDVRIFRALNNFEPPIYVLFFTLAGTHLDLKSLGVAGLIGLFYFLARIGGKNLGVQIGGRLGRAPDLLRQNLGMALAPQAGVAIGLIVLLASDQNLTAFSAIVTPVVLTGVFLSELLGPLCVRRALVRAGETDSVEEGNHRDCSGLSSKQCDQLMRSADGVRLVPWVWEKLKPHLDAEGVVVFGAAHRAATPGLARFATIFAHHYHSYPMAVRVYRRGEGVPPKVFLAEQIEVSSMGYPLLTELVPDEDVSSGLVAAVEYNNARAVVLAAPLQGAVSNLPEVLENVAQNVSCLVVVARFYGELHTERILMPVISMDELEEIYSVVVALDAIGEHQVDLLYLLESTESPRRIEGKAEEIRKWLAARAQQVDITVRVMATDARVETIESEAQGYDLVVMGATRTPGIKKFFFGSLADTVASRLRKTLLVVYQPENS